MGRAAARAPEAAVVAVAVGWIALRGIGHDFISFSDGAYLYAASRGAHALYGTVVSSLPPGGLLAAAAAWRISPHVETVRVLLAAIAVVTALLTYRVARSAAQLSAPAAVAAAAVATTAPLHAQFVGLEGDAFLTPLALALLLAVMRDRRVATVALLGAGFLFKVTWLPFALAALLVVARRSGTRAAAATAAAGGLVAVAGYASACAIFGWSPGDLFAQLVVAESRSGLQPELAGGIVLALVVMWWPLLALAPGGVRRARPELRVFAAAAAACVLFTLKQGTFFNVLDPFEPMLAILAVAGAVELGRRRLVIATCGAAAALHVLSLTTVRVPVPVGAAIVDVHNAKQVDAVVASIDAHARPGERVLVNPFFAVVGRRREVDDAADWFILHSLADGRWTRAKRDARGRVATLDSNVLAFDSAFRPTGVRILHVDAAPIRTTVYARRA
ncbi:MAG TPA: hypothetical protein VFA30_00990 [Gaiellaceae bacterium]|nr:hypothetical protein [Gaiellaceae bacterium]